MTNRMRAYTDRDNENGTDRTTSLFALVRLLLARRTMIMGIVGTVAVITAVILLLIPNRYASTASMLPSGGTDKMSDLKSLAGLSGMMGTDESSSDLFPDILTSQLIRDAVINRSYTVDNESTSLPDYFGVTDPDKLRRALAHITTIAKDRKTGVIRIAVETESPELSQQVATAYLEELEYFNRHKRTSRAAEKAQYLETQLAQRDTQLKAVEDSLEQFQMTNRDWAASSSPEVVMTLARLQRAVEIHSKAYLFLRQEYEVARLDAQKDIPIIQVLDPPTLPTMKSGPMRTMSLIIVFMLTTILTVTGTIVYEWLALLARTVEADSFRMLRSEVDEAAEPLRKITLRLKSATTERAKQ